MSPSNQMFARVVVIAVLCVAAIFACGPDFGIEVLQSREQVVLTPPTISFDNELKALAPPAGDKLPVVESAGGDGLNRATLEGRELNPAALARVTQMWTQSSGEAAYALGDDLPMAIRLYTAGAVSFSHGQADTARRYFQSIVELPTEERKSREVWARYMLGRVALQQNNQREAAAQFEEVRMLVRHGAPDQLGLAVASFGEQARGAWKHGDIANAVELYARQAGYGSAIGATSLVAVAGWILDDDHLLDRAVQDPLTLRLLFIYLNGYAISSNAHSKMDRIVAALENHGSSGVAGAGLLASAAYAQGRFDLAQKLAGMEDVPISAWVRAKLALRRGDRETAVQEYEKALRTFQPVIGDPTTPQTELAVLQVGRGDYIQALDLFYRASANNRMPDSQWSTWSNYWGDAAYLAERVLTIQELQDYVDHRVSVTAGAKADPKSERSRLRSVLARRLMRAGRRREALRYFDDQTTRSAAEQYDKALGRANSWWRLRSTRAAAWFTAAKLARNNGMELLGFEKEPDFAIWDGEFTPYTNSDEPKPGDPYVSADERKRVYASRPKRDVRFQYRLTAVDEAAKSADLLPSHSQAFAAVLCESTRWIIDRQPELAAEIYRRYLAQGAYVSWGRRFGQSCPQADFAAASSWRMAGRRMDHAGRHARAHPVSAGLLSAAVVALLTWLLYYFRPRRLHTRQRQ
jgi:tetratricopeptide (TPR) repeat protein